VGATASQPASQVAGEIMALELEINAILFVTASVAFTTAFTVAHFSPS
jgi:hypothetical protein